MKQWCKFLFFALVSCCGHSKDQGNKLEPSEHWQQLRNDYCAIFFNKGLDEEAQLANQFFNRSAENLSEEFSFIELKKILREIDCTFHLYAQGNEKVSETKALIENGVRSGNYFAHIHILAPSAHGRLDKTSMGDPKDSNWLFKTIVHEYAAVVLDQITRTKDSGWRFHDAPRWFVQGYEEYLSLMHSSDFTRTKTLPKYLAWYQEKPNGISVDFGIDVRNPYFGGALLMLFMHHTYGKKRVHAVLRSTEVSFGKAMIRELGEGVCDFATRFEKWQQQLLETDPAVFIQRSMHEKNLPSS